MTELFTHPEQIPVWRAAADGELPHWPTFLADYVAVVDYPAAAFWRELSATYPDALVLLSVRASADEWWRSADATIFASARRGAPPGSLPARQLEMATAVMERRLTPDWNDEAAAKRAYEAHNQAVRDTVPADRLLEWQPGDGWAPLCEALGVAVPDEPFPHTNTTAQFRAMVGLDA
ncbi:MAG: sulfotransferase family protein [Actinomyces sp.]|nr:MAG: sulfotransferase family protein [Actinomyces sp.]